MLSNKKQFNILQGQSGNQIMLLVSALIGIGIVMIYSSSAIYAERYWNDSLHFLKNQLINIFIGLIFMRFAMKYNYHKYKSQVGIWMMLTFILMLLVLIPGVGTKVSGARRWIKLFGFGFQPSELLKITLLFWVSSFLDRKKKVLSTFSKGLLPSFTVMGIYLFLLLLQPDFGTSFLISITILLMVFVAGVKPIHMVVSLVGIISTSLVLVTGSAYRMRRVTGFLDPWADPHDTGFQLIQSFIAYGSGGIFGRGLGDSRQKLFFLPQAHTDFIFSIIAEEAGFIGVSFILGLLLLLVIKGYEVALNCKDDFGRNLSFGITTILFLQSLLHIFVVTGLTPTKGIPLPFVSYGGSSMLINMFMAGILINISKSRNKR